ncbi:MAG: hypothetical protein V1776_00190 [Candidatus Diapherotrites archaeon]
MVKAYYIQYKFILPEAIKHSTYTYQKLFRAIYGYTQNVTKSNGKVYHYHRKGVFSDVPYIRPGKNAIIIHPSSFPKFKQFCATGQNPSHNWRSKGDWKAVYYMDEKEIDDTKVVRALEDLLDRTYISPNEKTPQPITEGLSTILDKIKLNETIEEREKQHVLNESQSVLSNEWFRSHYTHSQKLTDFNDKVKSLRGFHS